ncbi:MAG: AlpA family phage regulatory protein [Methylococcaceae bacterium]|nr:MAG: AlpA family phage regulatory protein [Methylococcaceae bacterium]
MAATTPAHSPTSRHKRLNAPQTTQDQPAPVHSAELWRLPRVAAFVGLAQSTIYLLMKRGEFPKPVPLLGRTKAWVAHDVITWAEDRASAGQEATT